jgi:hypothetical protein
MRPVDVLPFVAPYLLTTIVAQNNKKRERLGEQMARTVIIKL